MDLEQLEVVDASGNSELTSLQGLGDLRALKTINLWRCESLCRLSDMSKLTMHIDMLVYSSKKELECI